MIGSFVKLRRKVATSRFMQRVVGNFVSEMTYSSARTAKMR